MSTLIFNVLLNIAAGRWKGRPPSEKLDTNTEPLGVLSKFSVLATSDWFRVLVFSRNAVTRLGWVMFRGRKAFTEALLSSQCLGGEAPAATLNFQRGLLDRAVAVSHVPQARPPRLYTHDECS